MRAKERALFAFNWLSAPSSRRELRRQLKGIAHFFFKPVRQYIIWKPNSLRWTEPQALRCLPYIGLIQLLLYFTLTGIGDEEKRPKLLERQSNKDFTLPQ